MVEFGFTVFGSVIFGLIIGVYISYLFFLKTFELDILKTDIELSKNLDELFDIPSRLREDEVEDDSEIPKYLKWEYTCD